MDLHSYSNALVKFRNLKTCVFFSILAWSDSKVLNRIVWNNKLPIAVLYNNSMQTVYKRITYDMDIYAFFAVF